MSLVDRINAGATRRMQVGQRYRVSGIRLVETDDPFNAGKKRVQAVIDTPEGASYYCPSNISKACAESPDEMADLFGQIIEVKSYYSQRIRRDVAYGEIIVPADTEA